MNVKEMLDQVDTMVPNSISPAIKISWMNQVKNQHYRDYPFPEAIFPFAVIPGKRAYALPEDCPDSGIKKTIVDGRTYTYISSDMDAEREQFCTTLLSSLVIEPVPDQQTIGYLHYKSRPADLSAKDLKMVTNFPLDFHELLVLGCAFRTARAEGNLQLGNVLKADFDQMADKADRVLTKAKPTKVNIVRGWS